MDLRKLKRERRELGSLALFVDLDEPERGTSLQDVRRRQHVVAEIGRGLDESLANTARLHGWRVQTLFKAVVVELGGARLIKEEDEGECYSEDGAMVKLPDYRLVLGDGEMILVEVKNVAPGALDTKISFGEFEALERYAELNGARLLFAHYWSQANLWSMVDASVLSREKSAATLKLTDALLANEMGFLGDATIATTPPLVLRLRADPEAPRILGAEEAGGYRRATFTIDEVEILAAGTLLVDEEERRIAQALMQLGGWEVEETANIDENNEVVSVDFTHCPAEEQPGVPHNQVAPLSSLYSAAFNQATLDEDGVPSRLAVNPEPGRMTGLIPSDYWGHGERDLALWRFELYPSVGPRAAEDSARQGDSKSQA
jgi:hypothetical protein